MVFSCFGQIGIILASALLVSSPTLAIKRRCKADTLLQSKALSLTARTTTDADLGSGGFGYVKQTDIVPPTALAKSIRAYGLKALKGKSEGAANFDESEWDRVPLAEPFIREAERRAQVHDRMVSIEMVAILIDVTPNSMWHVDGGEIEFSWLTNLGGLGPELGQVLLTRRRDYWAPIDNPFPIETLLPGESVLMNTQLRSTRATGIQPGWHRGPQISDINLFGPKQPPGHRTGLLINFSRSSSGYYHGIK